jgi:hypothetical protein
VRSTPLESWSDWPVSSSDRRSEYRRERQRNRPAQSYGRPGLWYQSESERGHRSDAFFRISRRRVVECRSTTGAGGHAPPATHRRPRPAPRVCNGHDARVIHLPQTEQPNARIQIRAACTVASVALALAPASAARSGERSVASGGEVAAPCPLRRAAARRASDLLSVGNRPTSRSRPERTR